MNGRSDPTTGHTFVSYTHEDRYRVDRLQRVLEAAGISVWRDSASLWPGEDWRLKIKHAITDGALVFIACFSTASAHRTSAYQNEEIHLAIDQLRLRRPDVPWLIPVRFDDCSVPDWEISAGRSLSSIHHADVFDESFGEGAARLAAAILRILGNADVQMTNLPGLITAPLAVRKSLSTELDDIPIGVPTWRAGNWQAKSDLKIDRRSTHDLPDIGKNKASESVSDREISRPPDELSRVIQANYEWVQETRSYHFVRLLRVVDEIESRSGRLEASRVANQAMHKHTLFGRVTDSALLGICEELDAHDIFKLNWKLRRMLARLIGDIIGLHLGPENARYVAPFWETRIGTPDGAQLLAEAAVEHTSTAAALGAPLIKQLLLVPQPQVPWQLLRRWPLISPILDDQLKIDDIARLDNESIKRMLLITQMLNARRSTQAMNRLIHDVTNDLGACEPESPSSRLHRALVAWAKINTGADISYKNLRSVSLISIDQVFALLVGTDRENDHLGDLVASALELDSVERDLRNADGSYLPHPGERYSEGRYSYTRHYVRRAFHLVGQAGVSPLLASLLNCADEGIRWAVASEILTWWTLIPDPLEARSLTFRLIQDSHPWVVREAVQQLGADEFLCQAIGVDKLTRMAEGSRRRFDREYWVTTEIASATRRISAFSTYT